MKLIEQRADDFIHPRRELPYAWNATNCSIANAAFQAGWRACRAEVFNYVLLKEWKCFEFLRTFGDEGMEERDYNGCLKITLPPKKDAHDYEWKDPYE